MNWRLVPPQQELSQITKVSDISTYDMYDYVYIYQYSDTYKVLYLCLTWDLIESYIFNLHFYIQEHDHKQLAGQYFKIKLFWKDLF